MGFWLGWLIVILDDCNSRSNEEIIAFILIMILIAIVGLGACLLITQTLY